MSKKACRSALTLGFLIIASLVIAACGGGDSSSDTGSDTGTATAAETTGDGAGGPQIQLASALPITGQIYKAPEMESGMRAAMESVNAEGGVNGQELALNVCDTKFEANAEVACARQIAGEGPAAVVGPFMVADGSGAGWPIFEKAGLPSIGGQGGSLAEMNSPNAFLLGASFVGPFAGTAVAAEEAGAKSVAILTDDPNPAGKPIEEIIEGALQAHGITDVNKVIGHTESDPTFATAVAEATQGDPEAIVINATPTSVGAIVQGLRSAGYEGTIVTAGLELPPATIDALGDAAEGIKVTNPTAFVSDEANPGVAKFLEDMAEYQPDVVVGDAAVQGWSAMMLFVEAAKGAKAMDPEALMAAFEAVKQPIELGTAGPWSMVGKTDQVPGFSRIVNPTITIGTVEGGEVMPGEGGFVNPFEPPK